MNYLRAGVVCCLSMASLASAQVIDEQDLTAKNSKLPIEELTVYGKQIGYYDEDAVSALKQAVPLMETPLSVFVINQVLIADQQSFRLDKILQNDSSVQKENNFLGAYSSYSIRGFSLSNASNYLRDGRTFFHLSAPPTELLDRVEVLKGPASVLYGTMAPGGLINQIIKRPTQELAGFLKLTGGSYGLQHAHLDTGGAVNLSGSLRARLNVVSEKSESFREFFDGDAFEIEREIYGLALAWDMSESTLVTANFDYTDDDRPQDNGLIGSEAGIAAVVGYDVIYNQPWTHYNSRVTNALLEVEHQFSDIWGVKFGYSLQDFERDRYDNELFSFDPATGDTLVRARRRLNRSEYETYYADITGSFSTFGLVHNVLLGVDHLQVERNDREIEPAAGVFIRSTLFGPAAPDPGIAIGSVFVEGEEKREGVYFQDMIELGRDWRVLLGARYDDYQTTINGSYEEDNWTPRTGLLYLPAENLSVYVTYTEGFEPNEPVGFVYENAGDLLEPTVGTMAEVGYKLELFDGNLFLTGAAFIIERDGSPIVNIETRSIEQRGLQEHMGVELSASGLVGESLSVIASATYLDAEVKEDDIGIEEDDAESISIVGNTPAGVPELALSLWAEYQMGADLLRGLSVQAGVFYESDRSVDEANSFDLDDYFRVDIGAKYKFELANNNQLTSRLTVSNLFDEKFYKASNVFSIAPERPREIRFSIEYAF